MRSTRSASHRCNPCKELCRSSRTCCIAMPLVSAQGGDALKRRTDPGSDTHLRSVAILHLSCISRSLPHFPSPGSVRHPWRCADGWWQWRASRWQPRPASDLSSPQEGRITRTRSRPRCALFETSIVARTPWQASCSLFAFVVSFGPLLGSEDSAMCFCVGHPPSAA